MKKIINLLLIFIISIASVMAYGGGGSSYVYFKTTENKKIQTTLTHFDLKKKDMEYKLDVFTFKLSNKNLRYVDVYNNKKLNTLVFRTTDKQFITITDGTGDSIVIETNKDYRIEEIKFLFIEKKMNKVVIQNLKGIKKNIFGLESKGTYLVTTKYGTTQVSIFD